ncbi:MAG TPA: amidohydrolase family protein [Sandaracinaceae bacterium LLY-WYZ-13_1]|nr:amidohydrolase family protein [Sandaracinaceae bacterium LLY-WYZ-13_1]
MLRLGAHALHGSVATILAAAFLVACDGRRYGTDAGTDGGPADDARTPVDDAGPMDEDGGTEDGGRPPVGPSEPTDPAEVTRAGSGGLLLRGTVLAPEGPIDEGEVLIVGEEIRCVAESCAGEPDADTVTVVETNGVISPGLVDAHNHLTYDFLPEWEAPMLYDNRYTWADATAYEDHIAPFSDGRSSNDRICPGAKWGEIRSLIHATTTVQGQSFNRSCLDRLARNADHHHQLGYDHMRTTIGSVRDITDDDAMSLVESFTDPTEPTTRYAVHMQEGVGGGNLLEEFESFAGRDSRSNRHMGTSLLAEDGMYAGVGLLIHSMSLTEAQLMEVLDTEAHVVWSPSSNLVLYGQTADIATMLEMGISIGLGPDWTVSGEDEMLSEMRFAHEYGDAESIDALTPERIWRMATEGSADAVGLADRVGRLAPGMAADVAVFGRRGEDPYRAVLDSRAEDVRLVLVGGEGYYGDMNLETAAAVNGDCEVLDACGAPKFVCVANTPGSTTSTARAEETLEDVRGQLTDLLMGYGREEDLQALVACE